MDDGILSLKKQLLEKDAEIAALKSKLEKIQKVCIHIHMSNTAPPPICQVYLPKYCHLEATILSVIFSRITLY